MPIGMTNVNSETIYLGNARNRHVTKSVFGPGDAPGTGAVNKETVNVL
jgi:hypothetical protein